MFVSSWFGECFGNLLYIFIGEIYIGVVVVVCSLGGIILKLEF